MTHLLSVCLLCSAITGARPADTPDTALLPPDGFRQTWNKSDKQRVFTAGDLYGHINGGAEIFLEFGFEQLTVQHYAPGRPADDSPPAVEISIEIYRMSDPTAALGIYLMNRGKETRDPDFSERHCLNKYQLIFQRNRYYVRVGNSTGKESLRPVMLAFARHIASQLPADQALDFSRQLPKDGLRKSSVRLIRGQFGLQSIFTLGKGDVLQLGRKITAVFGSYRAADAGGGYSLIVADYPSDNDARNAFQNVRRHLDKQLTVQEYDQNKLRLAFKDGSGKFGLISVAGKRVTIKLHLSALPKGD